MWMMGIGQTLQRMLLSRSTMQMQCLQQTPVRAGHANDAAAQVPDSRADTSKGHVVVLSVSGCRWWTTLVGQRHASANEAPQLATFVTGAVVDVI
jgi:hypothetical protein